jgi:hypothetical protein
VYRIDSIGIFEGSDNTWLVEANFLGYEGRRVYGVLLHFQANGVTEVRPKMARVSTAQVMRPVTATIPVTGTPLEVRRQIASVLDGLGWGPDVTSLAMTSVAVWPAPAPAGK